MANSGVVLKGVTVTVNGQPNTISNPTINMGTYVGDTFGFYGTVNLSLKFPKVKRVIFNPPATIIIWEDDTKTVAKVNVDQHGNPVEDFDEEKGFTMAVTKKYFELAYGKHFHPWFERTVKRAERKENKKEKKEKSVKMVEWM